MIYKMNDLNDKLTQYIMKAYKNNVPLKEIEQTVNIAHNTLTAFLGKQGIYLEREYLPSFEIRGNKILIIADTHIGSRKENFSYIDMAYDKGVAEGVKACLHLGDLVQGVYDKYYDDINYQIKALDTRFPSVDEFLTYLILGNHDYSVFESNDEAKYVLENKKGLCPLGYKKVYFNWNNYLFDMIHPVKQLRDELPMVDVALHYIGHGHELRIKTPSKLKTPTLSDDIINQTNGAFPGFLIGTLNEDYLSTDVYYFKKGKVKLKKRNYFTKQMLDIYKVK